MTRDEVRDALNSGKCVSYHVWTWSRTYLTCSEGCCDDGFSDIEDTLDSIESWLDGEWHRLRIE